MKSSLVLDEESNHKTNKSWIMISIIDSGEGISQINQEKIYLILVP
jgi:signal transduction histidine kinase